MANRARIAGAPHDHRPVRGVASWQRGAVHVWGWDGIRPMPSLWLYRSAADQGWPDPPSAHGFSSSLDVTAPTGERLRPMSIRLDALSGLAWLRAAGAAAEPSVRWFSAVVELAGRVADGGALAPAMSVHQPDERVVQAAVGAEVCWTPLPDESATATLDALAAAMPAICLPDVPGDDARQRRRTVQSIFEHFVDKVARERLTSALWEPVVPRDRSPATAAARTAMQALGGHDSRVQVTRPGQADGLRAAAEALRRLRSRLLGEPVLERRVRLVVPEDRLDAWHVELELVHEADPGRWCSAADVWGGTPLAVEVAGGAEHLALLEAAVLELAHDAARAVDVLAPLADASCPAALELDVAGAEAFLEHAPAALERLGVTLLGPEHLVRAQVAVRGRAAPAPATDRAAGFGRETIVQWSFVAADSRGPAAITDAELARAELTGSSLLHVGHRWVRIDPEALRRVRERHATYVRRLDELTAAGHDAASDALAMLHLAADAAAVGDELGADADTVVSDAWAGLLLGGLPDARLREEVEPPEFRGTLRPYQRRGLSWLRFLHRLGLGGCLADDMGLGKTATTLAHLVSIPGPHLVVCPLSVVHNWETEATRFAPTLRVAVHHGAQRHRTGRDDGGVDSSGPAPQADVVVTTYGLVARDIDVLAGTRWSTVVLDEAQFVKNPATRSARAVRKLRAAQRVALTGTPVENRLSELWAILDWANPGMLGSRERFRHRYSKPIERANAGGELTDVVAADAAAALRSLTQPFLLRRSKADRQLVPELPEKIEQVAFAGLTREQAVLYQKVVDQLLEGANRTEGMKRRSLVLAALTKLKQICNHPAHALGDGSRLHGRSGKLARFDELVDELADVGERALVFSQFVEMGALLQRHLAERLGWSVPFLNGSLAKSRRDRLVGEFQDGGGPPLLLVSLRAGGTGLNLTAASQVIHYDRWWNPAVENQATDRAWRIGQRQTVLVHKLVCEGTVEERIAKLIDDKQALADVVVGSGEAWLSELSTAQLHELVRLDAPQVGRRE